MKLNRVFHVFAFLLLSLASCFAHHLAVVVAKDNNVGGLTSAELAKILKIESKKWPSGKDIVIVLHRNSAPESLVMQRLSKMSDKEVKALIAAHKDSIIVVDSDDDLLEQVRLTPGAIGLVNVHAVKAGVNVLKVDGKLPFERGYLPD
jgi:ABC-type phosphate transport system substrate-binding protein